MLNWDDLKFCLALDRHGSMVNAGKSLNANVATVSRRLERVTKDYGETLFVRNGQEWKATPAGADITKLAREIESHLAELTLAQDGELPDDAVIKLSVSVTIMQTFLRRMVAYRDGNKPFYNIDLTIHDRSLAYSESDVAVRYTRPEHGNYICAKVAEVEVCPYISAQAHTFPTDWIEIDYDGTRFRPADFGIAMPKIPKISMEGLNLSAQSVIQENYMAFLPKKFAERIPGLKQAAPSCASRKLDVWMIYHQSRKLDPLVRAGVEIVQASLAHSDEDITDAKAQVGKIATY